MLAKSREPTPAVLHRDQPRLCQIWASLRTSEGMRTDLSTFHRQVRERRERSVTNVEPVALERLTGWSIEERTGALRHHTGGFFAVEGLEVAIPGNAVEHWSQPVLHQPETGILGILVKELDGVLHCLMQLKEEPGNCTGFQLSPTVQATRSNYTGMHNGRSVPYLDYFRNPDRHHVLADVRQSEQGAWFLRKRNRNMIVAVTADVDVTPEDGFHWLTLGQVHQLLSSTDLVNMDTRTVLSCLPLSGSDPEHPPSAAQDPFRAALLRSCDEQQGSMHSLGDILSWVTDVRTQTDVRLSPAPLDRLPAWHRNDGRISHRSGHFFDVIGVHVEAPEREVPWWEQPMISARSTGLVAFLTTRIQGVLHVLLQLRTEPGYVDTAELAPTVQCAPENYTCLPAAARPPFLDEVLTADPGRVRFDTTLSEEGGRFYHTRNRHLIIESDEVLTHPDFRWMTLHQLTELMRHSNYINVEARSLVACLRACALPASTT